MRQAQQYDFEGFSASKGLRTSGSHIVAFGKKMYCCRQGTSKREKNRIFENFQVPLNSLSTSNLGAFGGPWLGLHGPSGHYLGPMGAQSTHIVTK
jgi:hypothetical protein